MTNDTRPVVLQASYDFLYIHIENENPFLCNDLPEILQNNYGLACTAICGTEIILKSEHTDFDYNVRDYITNGRVDETHIDSDDEC